MKSQPSSNPIAPRCFKNRLFQRSHQHPLRMRSVGVGKLVGLIGGHYSGIILGWFVLFWMLLLIHSFVWFPGMLFASRRLGNLFNCQYALNGTLCTFPPLMNVARAQLDAGDTVVVIGCLRMLMYEHVSVTINDLFHHSFCQIAIHRTFQNRFKLCSWCLLHSTK